jgi:hypothetical protein
MLLQPRCLRLAWDRREAHWLSSRARCLYCAAGRSKRKKLLGAIVKFTGTVLMFLGVTMLGMANGTVPEIGVGSAGSALALVSGAVLVLRGRKK